MLCFLMRYQNFQVVEIALAVIAPWSLELLVEIWIPLALLRHLGGGRVGLLGLLSINVNCGSDSVFATTANVGGNRRRDRCWATD